MSSEQFDVVVIGEPLIEFSAEEPLSQATAFRLAFSGDALNAAVAAAAAGAKVGLLTRLGRDELADRMVDFLSGYQVETSLIRREDGQTGGYVLGADPGGTRGFAYLRAGSAASRLRPSDVDEAGFTTRALLVSGITAALSPSCSDTVLHAARLVCAQGGQVVYDPNFRARLTTPEAAAAFLREIAPHVTVALPSSPGDTGPLLGVTDPAQAARLTRKLGARSAVVTCGADGALLSEGDTETRVPVVPAASIVDSTGAGDCFAGTLTARLALGDSLADSVALGMAAASLSLGGQGGTGRVPTLPETRAAAQR